MKNNLSGVCLVLFFTLFLSSCAATTGVDENPIMRKLSWFSYVNGDDMRPSCVAGAPEHYRLIYNGIYNEQVRIYEVNQKSKIFSSRIINSANIREYFIAKFSDLLNPWRGVKKKNNISESELNELTAAMAESDVFDSPPVGLRLSSRGFYWTVAACHQEKFYFTAYRWPSKRFENAKFSDVILHLDKTNIAFNNPRRVQTSNVSRSVNSDMVNGFTLDVGEDGLRGISRF